MSGGPVVRRRRGRPLNRYKGLSGEERAAVEAWDAYLESLDPNKGTASLGPPVIVNYDAGELARLRQEARINIPGITRKQRDQLICGLVDLVGPYRVMSNGQAAWKRSGGGNKHRRDLSTAVYDCGELWTRVTGKPWRKLTGWCQEGDWRGLLDQLPAVILAEELICLATGKPHPFSLERAYRSAKKLQRP